MIPSISYTCTSPTWTTEVSDDFEIKRDYCERTGALNPLQCSATDSDLKVTGGPAHPGPKISVWPGIENNFSWPCGPNNH